MEAIISDTQALFALLQERRPLFQASLANRRDDVIHEEVATIVETYGGLDHNALLRTLYDKYPAYARKSWLKRRGRTGR